MGMHRCFGRDGFDPNRSIADQLEEWSKAGKRSGIAFAEMIEAVRHLERIVDQRTVPPVAVDVEQPR